MEIIYSVLFFFGVLILGSATTDKGNEKLEPTIVLSNVTSIPGPHLVKPITKDSDLAPCHSDKSVVYRDLTVPLRGQIDQPGTGARDCEVNSNCSYHPTAFPSPTQVK